MKILYENSKLISNLWNGVNYNWSVKVNNLYDVEGKDLEYICKPFNPNKGIALSITNLKGDMSIWEFMVNGVANLDKLPRHVFKELMSIKHQIIIGFWENEGKVHLEYTLYFPNAKSKNTRDMISWLKHFFNQISVWDFAQQKELKEI